MAPFWLGDAVLAIKLLYVGYTKHLPYLFKFDSCKAPFRLGNAVLGIKLLYVGYTKHLPYLFKFDSCKARFFGSEMPFWESNCSM